jgi:RNA polymerase sigma-70 factor, ECF subfamily
MEHATLLTWNKLQYDLRKFVYGKVKDKATADDIVQDVFLKVQANLFQLKESEKITGWIYQITRHAVVDHFRRHGKTIKAADLNWESSHHEFNDCVAQCLRDLMLTLPDKYREALELTEINNLSQIELAEHLKISHSGARSRVQRARKMLRDKLESIYRIETDAYGNVTFCENRVPCCCQREC